MLTGLKVLAFGLYFIPTILGILRRHHNVGAILLLNLFLGWTFVGWVAALVWAATTPHWLTEANARWEARHTRRREMAAVEARWNR